MIRKKEEKTGAVLRREQGNLKSVHNRYFPGESFSYWIEHYWTVSWDLQGEPPFLAETLPYPSVHLVFEKGKSEIFGVVKKRFGYLLKDKGYVFGIKFRPGGFFPFLRNSVSSITDKKIPIEQVFSFYTEELETKVLEAESDESRIEIVESLFRPILPSPDPMIEKLNSILDQIQKDKSINNVNQIVKEFSIPKRSLQRYFKDYIGISPKWAIQRYRLQDLSLELQDRTERNFADIALELGYYDQAHLIKDFKKIIGQSPEKYRKGLSCKK